MEILAIIIGFVVTGILSFVLRNRRLTEGLSLAVTAVGLVVSTLVAYRVSTSGTYEPFSFISVDSLGALVMLLVSVVAFFVALYAVPYFRKETDKKIIDDRHVRQYYALSAIFLAFVLSTAAVSNPVAAWIFLEATTLSTVFLISFYRRSSNVEAAWKYLIVNAVGLLLAFFGTLLYFTSVAHGGGVAGLVHWDTLAAYAKQLDPAVVRIAFIFALIGYGTKVGLAPMHTWKPGAYAKSPAPLGALFSGALLPVAFLILLRFKSITDVAVGPAFSQHLLIGFGVLSIVIAAFSIFATEKNKRLLAYSSIEHAGIMALGFGFGGIGVMAAVLHMIYHSLVKPALFFLTGNMLLRYHSTYIADVRGAMSILPSNSVLYFAALFAIVGFPPFGMFLTEFFILSSGVTTYTVVVAVALLAMSVAFIGFFRHANAMLFGEPPRGIEKTKTSPWLLVPSAALLGITLFITFYTPPFVQTLIHEAVGKI